MKIIDYHHHILPKEVVRLIPNFNKSNSIWDIEKSIEFLEQNNLEGAVLSLYHPSLPVSNKDLWLKIVRTYNEAVSSIKKMYPYKFRAFAAVPFPYIKESISEINYAFDTLGLDGVCIFPITGEKQLDNEEFIPIIEELNKRSAAVLLHPINSEGIPVDNPRYLDSVLALTRFMYFDRFIKCKNIRFILSHTAGIIPFLADNMGVLQYMQDKKQKMGKFLWDYIVKKRLEGDTIMKSVYIDTSDCFDESALQSQLDFFNKDHILWGSDMNTVKNLEILKNHPQVFKHIESPMLM